MDERSDPMDTSGVVAPARMRFDAMSLVVASGVNALLGLLFWLAATRLYPIDVVGRASTILNTALVLSTVANLALGPVFERFFPVAGRLQKRLMLSAQAFTGVLALVLAAGFVVVGPSADLFTSPLDVVLFLVAVPTLAAFGLQDALLIGVNAGRWAAVQNVAHAVVKLVAIVGLASIGSSAALVGSWIVPALVAVVVVQVFLLAARGPLAAARGREPELPSRRALAGFTSSAFVWMLALSLPGLLLPLYVVSLLGADDAAYFNISWTIVSASAVLMGLATGPYVSASADPRSDLRALTRSFVKLMVVLNLARAILVAALGPIALLVYGREYADAGTPLLLLMGVSQVLTIPAYIYGNLARVYRRIVYPTVVQSAGAVLLVVLVPFLLPSMGILAIGWAFIVHELVVGAAYAVPMARLLRRANRGER